jgi:hypothetical protein
MSSETISPTAYELSVMASTMDPDASASPGGRFLLDCWSSWNESRSEYDDVERMIWECADCVVPISDYSCWLVFTDLGAWREDLSEHDLSHSMGDGDLTGIARLAVFLIAERLMTALEFDRRIEEQG